MIPFDRRNAHLTPARCYYRDRRDRKNASAIDHNYYSLLPNDASSSTVSSAVYGARKTQNGLNNKKIKNCR